MSIVQILREYVYIMVTNKCLFVTIIQMCMQAKLYTRKNRWNEEELMQKKLVERERINFLFIFFLGVGNNGTEKYYETSSEGVTNSRMLTGCIWKSI